ncbi:hypothetical protein H0E87_018268 [Populus deltoides]|uniref:Uncharacterized protein n=1 Tax=Populus deltoides TaxID=3696 RepID=A0A8T2XRF8_POPDE|nr:hypothetical protein H0E87_018268 [Populus deltoides]
MFPELEKPRVTEIQVRMDCNGVQDQEGIAWHQCDYHLVSLALLNFLVLHLPSSRFPSDPAAQTTEKPPEQAPGRWALPPPASRPGKILPQQKAPPAETAASTAEPPKDPPQPGENPSPVAGQKPTQITATKSPPGPKDSGEVHVIYHHPPDYGYQGYAYYHNYGG